MGRGGNRVAGMERMAISRAVRAFGPVLLLAAAVVCWRTWPQPTASLIKVENDVNDQARVTAPAPSQLLYDPYFIPENRFNQILIPTGKPK